MDGSVRIGVIGDFDPTIISHIPTNDAISHAAEHLSLPVDVQWLPTKALLDQDNLGSLDQYSGLLAAPGSPYASMDGAIRAIRCARERGKPFFAN